MSSSNKMKLVFGLAVTALLVVYLCDGYNVQDGTVKMSQGKHRRKVDQWTQGNKLNHKKLKYPPTKTMGPGGPDFPFRDPSLSWEARIDDLVGRLTLEEIVQQTMTSYTSPGTPGVPRLGIAPYPWITECLRGQVSTNGTAFPQALGLSSAFSPELMYNISTAVSEEVRAHWNMNVKQGLYDVFYGLTCYSPVVNIMRHPLWGRNQETYGEDPYLTGTLSQQFVKGLQGSDPRYRRTTATCKHFDAHGGPEDIPVSRFDFDARVTKRDWWMTFLPQFKMCIGAGAGGAMCSYNSINGVPACANKELLDIARKDWNFTGYITGDAGAIDNIVTHHHYLPNNTLSSAAVLNAGCNMEIQGTTLKSTLDAVSHGLLTETQVRENVKPLIYVRMRQGEFDPPQMNPYSKLGNSTVQSPAHRELAIKAAMMTFTLLKNDNNLLPLKKKFKTIAMVGPLTQDTNAQSGDYAANVSPQFAQTPYQGLRGLADSVITAPGCSDPRCEDYNNTALKAAVTSADMVIVSLGLGPALEGEMVDRSNLDFPGSQFDLLKDTVYFAAGRPVLLLLFTAGPLDLTWPLLTPGVAAILQCFYPAQSTGAALLRTLTGTGPGPSSPAGRLTATWPAYLDQVGPITNYNMEGRTYRYYKGHPLLPFGYGLSYSHFSYSSLNVTPQMVQVNMNITVSVTVTNQGPYDADEVVQVYLSWENPSLPAPKLQLVGFRRVSLTNGQETTVRFTVTGEQMALWMDEKTGFVVPTGPKILYAGGQQPNQRVQVPSNVLQAAVTVL